MKNLTNNELKQIKFDTFNSFTFESCLDLSGEIIIHTYKDYKQEDLLLAVSEFISFFTITVRPQIVNFIGFTNLKYKIL